ncbi:MAG: hypothetical protein KME32_30245 [Mojavia pulchra JT2-VF2]|jgi:hypothetical protein|uniref:Uncharacterized protein n=1 Tax=Mojavia pulchra JT2-VF2 TaxID=287848 RepID=A0A951UIZ7_9NOST|nr:hypothetical protein [Mojavia pulchra JT2-VF2]
MKAHTFKQELLNDFLEVDCQNGIDFQKLLVIQLHPLQKWPKNVPIGEHIRAVNSYIGYLIKKLNNLNFRQICDCNISYFVNLSKLAARYFLCSCAGVNIFYYGSLAKYRQGWLQQLKRSRLLNDKRYKINFVATQEALASLSLTLVENLLTGKTFIRNECYKVAT